MNGFVVSPTRWLLLLALAVVLTGCKKESNQTNPPPEPSAGLSTVTTPAFQTGPSGKAIVRDMVARYATATSYSDKAVLYLSYQLEGRNIQEPQRWSTHWDNTGRIASQMFNSNITGDGELLSCYVYDIETANLDNQHLVIPYNNQLPINRLFRDSIAKHFLGGYSELPLDETDMISAPKLIPIPISLLTNQARCGWLQSPSVVERLPDQTYDGKSCYVVRCLSDGTTADAWIDQQTKTLVKISLPLKLLAGEVVTTPEITNVVLMAEFHEAVLDGPVADESFAIKPRPDATPVLKYVALPDPFPSELIGEPAPEFNLVDNNAPTKEFRSIGRLHFDGKVTALLWLAGRPSYAAIRKLDRLAAKLPDDKFHLAAVYSDSELKEPGAGNLKLVDELAAATANTSLPVYYDMSLRASTALQIKSIPSIIVLDGDSKVQYAQTIADDTWLDDVKAAINRVAAGDNVAGEMLDEYRRFLDSYHQQLLTVSAVELIGTPETATTAQVSHGQGKGRLKMRLRPEQAWTNATFKRSGNVAVAKDPTNGTPLYFVFDGWRTVVQVDSAGQTKTRMELDLPDGEAANLIRSGTDSTGQPLFVVFSALGKRAYLFDAAWKPVGVYPDNDVEHAGIRDCRLTDLDQDGKSELVVSFNDENGIHLVDPMTATGQKISDSVASSVTALADDIVISGQGKIGMLKTGLTSVEDTELQFRRVASLGSSHLCGLGMTDDGQWNAVGFDSTLQRVWTLSIGAQFFETEIEPIAVTNSQSGEVIWAIADIDDSIHLVSGNGKWLGDFQSDSRLGGIALSTHGSQTNLVVSNESGVVCWNLNLITNPMRPVSTRK